MGVHHTKFAVFDNSVILTGANFEEQYFLNRRDRYWIINNCQELADYLEDYSINLINSSEKIAWDGEKYGVSTKARRANGLSNKALSLFGIKKGGGYSSLNGGEGTQTLGISSEELKIRLRNSMGVFSYMGYNEALGVKEKIETKMVEGKRYSEDRKGIEEKKVDVKAVQVVKSGKNKESVLEG